MTVDETRAGRAVWRKTTSKRLLFYINLSFVLLGNVSAEAVDVITIVVIINNNN